MNFRVRREIAVWSCLGLEAVVAATPSRSWESGCRERLDRREVTTGAVREAARDKGGQTPSAARGRGCLSGTAGSPRLARCDQTDTPELRVGPVGDGRRHTAPWV